jgi:hypothetical protein
MAQPSTIKGEEIPKKIDTETKEVSENQDFSALMEKFKQMQEEIEQLKKEKSNNTNSNDLSKDLISLLNSNSLKNNSIDEEVTIIFNLHGTARVIFPTWTLDLKEFGEERVLSKQQFQDLIGKKRSYFSKEYIVLHEKHMDLAQKYKITVYSQNSNLFMKSIDLDRFGDMDIYEIESYYNKLSENSKKHFLGYFMKKCYERDEKFFDTTKMQALNKISKSNTFEFLLLEKFNQERANQINSNNKQ